MKRYYLFEKDPIKLTNYKQELLRVRQKMDEGKTPVFSEMRCVKTDLAENVPRYTLAGAFLILGTWFLSQFKIPNIFDVAIVLIVNNLAFTLANYVFTSIKHKLRIKLCKRLELEPTEEIIAAMESMEYQSV